MELIGLIVPTQEWQSFPIPLEAVALIADYLPLMPDLEEIRSFLIVRRSLSIGNILVKDEPFKTLPKNDSELIIFRQLPLALQSEIQSSSVEIIKIYKPSFVTYEEPNYFVNLYYV